MAADAVSQIVSLPWWAQILPGLNVAALFFGIRRLNRLEFMVETLWKRAGIDEPDEPARVFGRSKTR